MINIIVSDEIETVCPGFVGAAVEATAQNSGHSDALWQEIGALSADYRSRLTTESLKQMPAIEATRRVYRACGNTG